MLQPFFFKLLTYLLGFQLVVGAIPQQAASLTAWAGTCEAGLEWNEMLGRCVTTAEAAQLKEASLRCEKLPTHQEKMQCYREVIEGKMKDAKLPEKGKIDQSTMSLILALASLVAAAGFLMTNSGDCPGATSAYLMGGSALAVFAGEIMSAKKYKEKLKAAEEKFKKVSDTSKGGKTDNKNATSAQAEAFQAMIEMEEATISAAKTKNMLYMVATAGYAAATVMSAIETVEYYTPGPQQGATQAALTCTSASSSYNPNPFFEKPQASQYVLSEPVIESSGDKALGTFLQNYFLKNQRVSFQSYQNTSYLLSANDSIQLAFLNRELIELKNGATQSTLTAQGFQQAYYFSKTLNQDTSEEMDLMRTASVVAQQFIFPQAQAQNHTATADATVKVAKEVPSLFSNLLGKTGASVTKTVEAGATQGAGPLKKLFQNPVTRLVLSGIMTVNNLFMIKKTNEEKKKAEKRKAFLEKLKAQVEAAGQAFSCTGSDRSDLSKPNCYCYSETGGLNPARINSNICKNLFGGKPNLASKKDTNAEGIYTDKNCVSKNGSLDSSCSCRQSNSCLSVQAPSVVGNVPSSNVLGDLPATINGLNNGSLSAADINASNMQGLAARSRDALKRLTSDPKNKKLAQLVAKAQVDGEKIMKDLERKIASNPGLAVASTPNNDLLGSTSPAAALQELKKEIDQQITSAQANAAPFSSGKGGKSNDEFSLDGLNNLGGVTIADEQIAGNLGDASFDIGNSDINSDSDANIFSILSNRYQRSGMPRLFGNQLGPVEKPAEEPRP